MTHDRTTLQISHPLPGPDQAALLASYELMLQRAADCLPVAIPAKPGQLFFEEWETTRAAFMARMASTLRHLGYLAPSYSRLDGLALTRTLVDHTITFAWISADPNRHLPRFLRTNFSKALDWDKALRARGDQLLDEALRPKYRDYVRTHTADIPGLLNRAKEADEKWLDPARSAVPPPLQLPSLVELYDNVYDEFAHLDHPSVTALQLFVHTPAAEPQIIIDGELEREREADLRPYWLGLWSLTWALIVASTATGRPRPSDLSQTINQVRALREYERHKLLEITEQDGMTRIGLMLDTDRRIDDIAAGR